MDLNGIFLVDKEAGPSSAQVLNRLKKHLNLSSKVGHAGTLDPFATGLLLVLIGKATRLADLFQAQEKIYSGLIELGSVSNTEDVTGEICQTFKQIPNFEIIQKAAHDMIGEIDQLPSKFSALNVNGKRAYDLARKGESFELKSRKVLLKNIKLEKKADNLVSFELQCSKGFYVRAFARDLGEKLGCGAYLKSLRREACLPFSVSEAFKAADVNVDNLIAWDKALRLLDIREIKFEDKEFSFLKNGLVPYSLDKYQAELDSYGNGLVVYRRQSDGLAGGLLSKQNRSIEIVLNL